MDVILDTSGLLALSGMVDKSLNPECLNTIKEAGNVYVSAASLFEIGLKFKRGKLNLGKYESSHKYWEDCIHSYDLQDLAVDSRCFANAVLLPDIHLDPFDRIIISEAIRLDVAIVTFDKIFDEYGVQTMS